MVNNSLEILRGSFLSESFTDNDSDHEKMCVFRLQC